MNDYIKKQLSQVSYADLSHFDTESNTFTIPKYTKPSYDLNSSYIVKLPPSLVNNTSTVLATNWNNGTTPIFECLKIYVSKRFNRYIYVDALGFNLETGKDLTPLWSGWLPIEELTLIQKC